MFKLHIVKSDLVGQIVVSLEQSHDELDDGFEKSSVLKFISDLRLLWRHVLLKKFQEVDIIEVLLDVLGLKLDYFCQSIYNCCLQTGRCIGPSVGGEGLLNQKSVLRKLLVGQGSDEVRQDLVDIEQRPD